MAKQISINIENEAYDKIKAQNLPWRRILYDGIRYQDQKIELEILKKENEKLQKANARLQQALLVAQESFSDKQNEG